MADISREIEYFEEFIPTIDQIVSGEVRSVNKEYKEKIHQILNDLTQNENIAGAGIFSFTGINLANLMTDKQKELFDGFFTGIFCRGVSGITRVIIDTHNYSIYITNLEEDCLLVVFSNTKRFQTSDRKKISETILKINEIIA